MKFALKWCVVPLMASALVAQTAPKPKKKVVRKPVEPQVSMQDVQALKDALAAQQAQIESLKQELQTRDQNWQSTQQQLQAAQSAATDAQQKAAQVQSVADAQKDSVTKLSSDMDDVKTTLTNTAVNTQEEQKKFAALEGLVGRFRFNGDVRVRGESFFQSAPGFQDRNRGRIRVRFGVDGKLGDDFVGGFYLASGSLGDPTSTNTTLTNYFEKKTIGIDRGYITYNPRAFKPLSITAGKFAYTWNRTPVTFDSDLNPEGFSEKLSFDLKSPFFKNFTFQLMQLLYNESSGGTDSYALGGQVSAKLQLGHFWTAVPSFTLLKWNNVDSILNASAFAVGATTTGVAGTTPLGPFPTPGEGPGCARGGVSLSAYAPCAFGPNGITNGTFFDASGKAHYLSQYNYADFILNNTIATGVARLPINIVAEFEQNLDAAAHPFANDGSTELTNLGAQDKAYGVDFSIGQAKAKNDIQIGYAWLRQEQDSVLAAFNESDQRAPTNILQNKIYGTWKLRSNVTAGYTFFWGRTLNTGLENSIRAGGTAAGGTEPDLRRMQFDLVYTF
ncbi:MAG TPA: putative porin [Terriglobales bacterium]|nr:putative porin [Terriglobales bacterium]